MKSMFVLIAGLGVCLGARAQEPSHSVEHKMEGYVTLFKVVAPEGAKCTVTSDSSFFGEQSFEVPFKFKAQDKFYYTFDCRLPSGRHWRKKLEPKANHTTIVSISDGGTAPAAEGPSGAASTGADDFERLLASVKGASFEGEKIQKVQMAAKHMRFSVEQVGRIIDAFDFSAGKIKVVELTAGRLTDPDRSFQILDHFEFDADKQQAQKLLK